MSLNWYEHAEYCNTFFLYQIQLTCRKEFASWAISVKIVLFCQNIFVWLGKRQQNRSFTKQGNGCIYTYICIQLSQQLILVLGLLFKHPVSNPFWGFHCFMHDIYVILDVTQVWKGTNKRNVWQLEDLITTLREVSMHFVTSQRAD